MTVRYTSLWLFGVLKSMTRSISSSLNFLNRLNSLLKASSFSESFSIPSGPLAAILLARPHRFKYYYQHVAGKMEDSSEDEDSIRKSNISRRCGCYLNIVELSDIPLGELQKLREQIGAKK